MADEVQEIEGQDEALEKTRSGSGKLRLLALLAVVLGGGLGFVVVGPMVTGGPAGAAAATDASGHEPASDDHDGGGAASVELFSVENMVVNPAGTEGVLRFLMVTVAVEPTSAAVIARLESNEVVLRDALLRTFALHTTDQLLDMAARPALLDTLREVIEEVVGTGSVNRIFLPQYVIQ